MIYDSPTPALGDLEYTVRVQFWLPLPHARLLRETALHHYDYKVRESAERGPINGLHNVAIWASEHEREGPPHAVSWGDMDTMRKALEQARPRCGGDITVLFEINSMLQAAQLKVERRSRCLNDPACESLEEAAFCDSLEKPISPWSLFGLVSHERFIEGLAR